MSFSHLKIVTNMFLPSRQDTDKEFFITLSGCDLQGNHNENSITERIAGLEQKLGELEGAADQRRSGLVDNSAFLQFMWKTDVVDSWIGQCCWKSTIQQELVNGVCICLVLLCFVLFFHKPICFVSVCLSSSLPQSV